MSEVGVDKIAPFWRTVSLLWKTTRLRAKGRAARQRALMKQRNPKAFVSSGTGAMAVLTTLAAVIFMIVIHSFMAFGIRSCVATATRISVEKNGKLAVENYTFDMLAKARTPKDAERALNSEVWRRTQDLGGDRMEQDALLQEQYRRFGVGGFVKLDSLPSKLGNLRELPPLAMLMGGVLLLWWFVMLTFQGEGLELDIQRRRHPMWEWLLSHPIRPEAAFLAEMVAPLAVNPVYLTAPIFWIVLLGQVYSVGEAIVGGLVIGLAVAFAAGCLNKTIELCAMLRLSVRSRGAVLGIVSWLGYAGLLIPLFTFGKPAIIATATDWLYPAAKWLHPPLLAWVLGEWSLTHFSLVNAIVAGCGLSGALLIGCVTLSAWGTKRGLEGGFDGLARAPRLLDLAKAPRFGRDPLYRKELLWFWRDRGAVVQAVLIPLTVAAMQAFNLRQVVEVAGHQWNSLCALAIICGTYFLIILGPRSLASEGPALWLALTWPRGLEDLLKAKARLWWFLSSVIVGAVLIFVTTRFPGEAWKVALVAAGWWFFSRSLAEKAVTLVTAPNSSGELEPISRSRQWTAMLGTLAFGSGVMSQNWHLAIIGIVFSSLTAAAMWQNLRARLPFLYDPWSEKFPPPPTLMHAMIAIACMVEGVAVISAFIVGFGGKEMLFMGQAIAYGAGAAVTFAIMHRFLAKRGVSAGAIWYWPPEGENPSKLARTLREGGLMSSWTAGGLGVCMGAILGLLGIAYGAALWHIPEVAKVLQQHADTLRGAHGARLCLGLMAVVFAPVAEEYLFRGMLYRALDREWGGWRALVGSAAFFAIYHPPLAWVPVFGVGLVNAYLFKQSGRLAPCVFCHMVYNAIVVLTS